MSNSPALQLPDLPTDETVIQAGVAAILTRFPGSRPPTIECSPGWYPLLVALDSALAPVAPDYQVLQIKEKFGGLRYYVDLPQDPANVDRSRYHHAPFTTLQELITQAEQRSFTICETCGAPADSTVLPRGYSPRCADHRHPYTQVPK
jgi:hypothetical protein